MTALARRKSSTTRSVRALDRRSRAELAQRLVDGGILSHAAGPTDDGWRVVDVWESEEAFQRFGQVIGPILQEVGMPGQPQLFPLDNFVK